MKEDVGTDACLVVSDKATFPSVLCFNWGLIFKTIAKSSACLHKRNTSIDTIYTSFPVMCTLYVNSRAFYFDSFCLNGFYN